MSRKRWLLLALLASAGLAFYALGLNQYLSLEFLKAQHQAMLRFKDTQPIWASAFYVASYIVIVALSLPGAALMTLAGGAVFGLWWALPLAAFAATTGGTLSLLASRFLFREWVQTHFAKQANTIDEGLAREGWLYVLSLRLVPVFPFFLINLALGLTAIRVLPFYAVTFFGIIPGVLVYLNAGTQLAQIDSLAGILSPAIIASLCLLAVFPLLARKLLDAYRLRRLYAR